MEQSKGRQAGGTDPLGSGGPKPQQIAAWQDKLPVDLVFPEDCENTTIYTLLNSRDIAFIYAVDFSFSLVNEV